MHNSTRIFVERTFVIGYHYYIELMTCTLRVGLRCSALIVGNSVVLSSNKVTTIAQRLQFSPSGFDKQFGCISSTFSLYFNFSSCTDGHLVNASRSCNVRKRIATFSVEHHIRSIERYAIHRSLYNHWLSSSQMFANLCCRQVAGVATFNGFIGYHGSHNNIAFALVVSTATIIVIHNNLGSATMTSVTVLLFYCIYFCHSHSFKFLFVYYSVI